MAWIADIVSLLEASSLNLRYGVNLFKGPKARIPDGAGPYVSLIRASGLGAEGTHNSPNAPAYERPIGQVLVRANDYEVAEVMVDAIYALLWPVANQVINGTYWRTLNCRSEPFDLPPDEKDRPRIAFNFDCVKRVSPSTS